MSKQQWNIVCPVCGDVRTVYEYPVAACCNNRCGGGVYIKEVNKPQISYDKLAHLLGESK